MSAVAAILRLELRLLRRELLLGAVVLAVTIGALLPGEAQGSAGALGPVLQGSVLLVLVAIGVTRVASVRAAWSGLMGALPVSTGQSALARLLLWAGLTLVPACAYALWATGLTGRPLRHLVLVWLWLTLAGVGVTQLVEGRRRVGGRPWQACIPLLATLTLLGTLQEVVTGVGGRWSLDDGAWLLAVGLALLSLREAAGKHEWLPSQSPKEVRPRGRVLGRFLERRIRSRSPRQVRTYLGVGRVGLSPAAFLVLLYGVNLTSTAFADARSDEASPLGVVLVVLVGGLFTSTVLAGTSGRWALLRAYPVSRAAVWARPLACVLVMGTLWLGGFAWVTLDREPSRIADPLERGDGLGYMFDWGLPFPGLRTPSWAAAPGATAGRPTGMPPPLGRHWPLRPTWVHLADAETQRAVDAWNADLDQAQYFVAALRYYLAVVHGVRATDAELLAALGDPVVVERTPARIPTQHYFEDLVSRGYGRFSLPSNLENDEVQVWLPGSGDGPNQQAAVRTPIVLYAFAPALDRLQASLGQRVERAALHRRVLDLCIVLLSILAFVWLAFSAGVMRLVLPLLALLPAALWFGSRGTELRRWLRDAHLAWPWVAPALTVVLVVLLVVSIRRRLGNVTPGAGLAHV